MSSFSEETILVTAANGYIALHVIDHLLHRGYNVRGTVRSQVARDKVRTIFHNHDEPRLEIVLLDDLTRPEAYAHVLDEKITGVIHTDSPVHSVVEDAFHDMLYPAIRGATAILDALSGMTVSRCKRVVHLSSFAAMLDMSQGRRPEHTFIDKDWNPITQEQALTLATTGELYVASKALSERAVWDWLDQKTPDLSWDLVCVNPSMVLGPHMDKLTSMATKSTGAMLWALVDAESIPPLLFGGCVDVRDLAAMLVAAFEVRETAGQRLLLVAHYFDWQTAATITGNAWPELRDRVPEPAAEEERTRGDIYGVDGEGAV